MFCTPTETAHKHWGGRRRQGAYAKSMKIKESRGMVHSFEGAYSYYEDKTVSSLSAVHPPTFIIHPAVKFSQLSFHYPPTTIPLLYFLMHRSCYVFRAYLLC